MIARKKIIAIGLISIVGVGAGVLYSVFKKSSRIQGSTSTVGALPTPSPVLALWNDPAGLTFRYPEGLVIDKHDEDTQNYAHLEMTNRNHRGNVTIWAKDTTAVDLQSWVRTDARFKGANIIDTTLGNISAKKIVIPSTPKMVIVGTITDGILFTVESSLEDSVYWEGVQSTIVDSFLFTPVENDAASDETGTQSNDGGSSEEAVDEEEVLE